MIIDTLKNAGLYQALGVNIGKALDYLAATDFSAVEPGRYDLDGDNLFALVQRYDTKPHEKGVWEAHRRYIDVQYVASGIETMGYAHIDDLSETQAYSAEKDYLLLAGAGDFVTVRAGVFVVFFPQDAHMPCLTCKSASSVQKVVVKVLAGAEWAPTTFCAG